MQGGTNEVVEALRRADLAAAPVTEPERALLEYARLLTESPGASTQADIDHLRQASWTDEQIAEAVYIIALFAFFNRVADAFGLPDPNYGAMAADDPNRPAAQRGGGGAVEHESRG